MSYKKKILFIINPISGKGKGEDVESVITHRIDTANYEAAIRKTEYAGHASVLAREAAERGFDMVVAVGGDGTVNEVARAIVETPTALGIIPCGSGNGLARHLRIPMHAQGAVDIINQGVVHDLDYGKINGHPFFCTCGVGFDAFVSLKFAEGGKRGFLSYVEKTLREGVRYKPETYIISYGDHTEEQKAFLIACANASQYGNNAYIAPGASMKDGLMDVIVMEPFYTIEAPQVIMQLFNKSLPSNNHVKVRKASKISILRPSEGAVHLDGDPMTMGREIQVEILHSRFRVVVNPAPPPTQGKKNPLRTFADLCTEIIGIRN